MSAELLHHLPGLDFPRPLGSMGAHPGDCSITQACAIVWSHPRSSARLKTRAGRARTSRQPRGPTDAGVATTHQVRAPLALADATERWFRCAVQDANETTSSGPKPTRG